MQVNLVSVRRLCEIDLISSQKAQHCRYQLSVLPSQHRQHSRIRSCSSDGGRRQTTSHVACGRRSIGHDRQPHHQLPDLSRPDAGTTRAHLQSSTCRRTVLDRRYDLFLGHQLLLLLLLSTVAVRCRSSVDVLDESRSVYLLETAVGFRLRRRRIIRVRLGPT